MAVGGSGVADNSKAGATGVGVNRFDGTGAAVTGVAGGVAGAGVAGTGAAGTGVAGTGVAGGVADTRVAGNGCFLNGSSRQLRPSLYLHFHSLNDGPILAVIQVHLFHDFDQILIDKEEMK